MPIHRRAFLGFGLTAVAGRGVAAFRDPLQSPAIATRRLANTPMTAMARPSASRIVAAGWRGTVLVSSDDGANWRQAEVPVSVDLTALCFTDDRHGWATGGDGVLLETADGGTTWQKRVDGNALSRSMLETYRAAAAARPDDRNVASALKEAQLYVRDAPARPLLDAAFETEQVGYAVGAYGLAFRTADAGRTWAPIIDRLDNPNGYHLYAVATHRGNVFIAGELGTILRLDRAQDRFVKIPVPYDGTFFTLISSEKSIVAGGLRGNAVVSSDAGQNWDRVAFEGGVPGSFSGGAALGADGMVIATQSGELFRSVDDGRQFRALRVRSPMSFSAVVGAGTGGLLTAGSQGIRREALA